MEVTPGWETVELAMDPSGFIEARIGASPHGQGLRTTLSQIIADELGTSPDRIKIVHGDTDRTPYGWGTFASRSLVIAGGATLMAARKVRAKLIRIASMLLEASADDIVLEADMARVAGTDRAIEVATLARVAYHQTHRLGGDITPGLSRERDLRSGRHVLQCLPCRRGRGRHRDRRRAHRRVSWWRRTPAG